MSMEKEVDIVYEKVQIGALSGLLENSAREIIEEHFTKKSRGDLVKSNITREVIKIGDIYVKRFKQIRFVDDLKRSLFGTKARKEFEILAAAHRLGINVPEPIGYLEGEKDSYLLNREIPGSRVAKSILAGGIHGRADLEKFLKSLAEFVNSLLDKGFLHRDLHIGNILYANGEFFVIDVHRADVYSRLSKSQRFGAYAQMLHSLYKILNRHDLQRFLVYCGLAKSDAAEVWRRMMWLRRIHLHSRARRCLINSTEFKVEESNGGKTFVRKPFEWLLSAAGGSAGGGEKWKGLVEQSRTMKDLPGRVTFNYNDEFCIKRWRYGFTKKVGNVFAGSPAYRFWYNSNALQARAISAQKALLLIESADESVLVLEWVSGLPLLEFVRRHFKSMSEAQRRDFVYSLAWFVVRLHVEGVYHHDLKGGNILVRFSGASFKFTLIDLDRVSYYFKVPLHLRLHNLAQLNASVGSPISVIDRYRFLKYYTALDSQLAETQDVCIEVMRRTIARKHIWPG